MPFQKGQDKTGGRKPGTPNKTASELREQLQHIIDTSLSEFPAILAAMEPTERIRLVATLLPYVMPKLSSVDLNAVVDAPKQGATLRAWTAGEIDAYDQWRQTQEGLPTILP